PNYIHHRLTCFVCNHTATPDIYTLSLHDALPIFEASQPVPPAEMNEMDEPGHFTQFYEEDAFLLDTVAKFIGGSLEANGGGEGTDRKSTRLNSSHVAISYAVFCLKKKRLTTGTPT